MVEVRLVMAGEFLHAVAQIENSKMTGTDLVIARREKKFAAAPGHVGVVIVEVRAGDLFRAANANVVGGGRTGAAGAVVGQKIIPTVVIDKDRGLAIVG